MGRIYATTIQEERTAYLMYIDPEIKLRDDLPSGLREYFSELQEYYDKGDWLSFDRLWDDCVESSVKICYHDGRITMEDLQQIFRKYGFSY